MFGKFYLKMDQAGEGGAGGGAGTGEGSKDQGQGQGQSGTGQGTGENGAGEGTGPKSLEEAMDIIKSLRNENAKHRTKNKTLEESLGKYDGELKKVKEALGIKDESEDPKVALANLQQTNEALQVEMSVMSLAMEHQIPFENQKYFKFLLGEKFESLGEGEELSDEDLAEVIAQAKGIGGGQGKKSTGLNGGAKPNEGANQGVTVEQFAEMSIAEKSDLYGKNPQLYQQLFQQAVSKKLLK